jgi:hypothetical protein
MNTLRKRDGIANLDFRIKALIAVRNHCLHPKVPMHIEIAAKANEVRSLDKRSGA